MKVTITEALAEIKTIEKRVAKKKEFVLAHLYRQERLKDPLQADGGSVEAVRQERQAIADLDERKVAIRRAVQQANVDTDVTVSGTTRSVADWLVWRREVAPGIQAFLNDINGRILAVRQEAMRNGFQVTSENAQSPNDVVVNINEAKLADSVEQLEEILGNLDGQLSLKNATVFVEI